MPPSPRHVRCAAVVPVVVVLSLFPAAARAQAGQAEPWEGRRAVGHATLAGANALLAGLTAGVTSAVRGHGFSHAFARGMAGGAVAYAGRRIGVERWPGAGLVGRQVSAVGIAVVRNAGEGRAALGRIMLPLGPLHFYLQRGDSSALRVRVGLPELLAAAVLGAQSETALDLGASLSAGTPVFRAPMRRIFVGGNEVEGLQVLGTILLEGAYGPGPHVLPHERVHVLQHDFFSQTWSAPLDDWILDRVGLGGGVAGWLDLDLSGSLLRHGLERLGGFAGGGGPVETEAYFLARP